MSNLVLVSMRNQSKLMDATMNAFWLLTKVGKYCIEIGEN